jgi:hypothetical protein
MLYKGMVWKNPGGEGGVNVLQSWAIGAETYPHGIYLKTFAAESK